MVVVCFINSAGFVLILAAVLNRNVAAEHSSTETNRTCRPAKAEPSLNSSSCYPLVKFTRPFCQNHGITLPSHVYMTPTYQIRKNHEANRFFDGIRRLGLSSMDRLLSWNVTKLAMRKCLQIVIIIVCHNNFPICDRTQDVVLEQKVCRESCLTGIDVCGKMYDSFFRFFSTRYPKSRKKYSCELQPYRNAGDSPECYYLNGLTNSTGTPSPPRLAANSDCLHFSGSSYRGNIAVTVSGTPCQSWTEQCPHRHTMNKTYPELNDAKNFCRNPQNSGKRPWCFTTDRNKRWEYCDIPKCIPVDGNYGNWSLSNTCNVTCGEGFEIWSRICDNPKPKYGGRNCSHLGEPVQSRSCSGKHCPVHGGYTNWTLSTPCNVSCGDGVEILRRTCNNPVPKYGGRNCSGLGVSFEFKNCSRPACPIDGNYGNWTKSSPCSVTCGQGVEIWTRRCDNPPGKYGGNCSSQGFVQENRMCEMEPCPVHIGHQTLIGLIVVAAVVLAIFVTVLFFIFYLRRQRRKTGSSFYAVLNFSTPSSGSPQSQEVSNNPEEVTNSSQQTATDATYQNLSNDENPIPGFSRGVVHYRRDYMNTRATRNSWYDRLQLIRPLAMEWLRNAWGNVDQFGRHVYDVMQRAQHEIFGYNKLSKTTPGDLAGNGRETNRSLYNTLERPSPVSPSRFETQSTTQSV